MSDIATVVDQPGHRPLVENPRGRAGVVVVCEHASPAIPADLNGLGLAAVDALSHAAWDPGALGVARAMGRALDAVLVAATVSRLVHDCNRPAGAPEAMPSRTETVEIPGNAGLSAEDRAERARLYYEPFRRTLADCIRSRPAPSVLVTVHSFTPRWHGAPRDVELGILHDADARLADAVLARAPAHTGLRTARNEPYGPAHGVTHTLREHAVGTGAANVMIEIRNDLIADDAAQARMGGMLAALLTEALAELGTGSVA